MVMNLKMKSIMYLIIVITSVNSTFVSAAAGDEYEYIAPIFAIHPDLLFRRTPSDKDCVPNMDQHKFPPNETMMTYVSMVTQELAEMKSSDCMEKPLAKLSLRPAYLKISSNDFTLLNISWMNATDLHESFADFTLTASYSHRGSNGTKAKIMFQVHYAAPFLITGKALFRRDYEYEKEEYTFSVALGDPEISYEYHRELSDSGKVNTTLINESLQFKYLHFRTNAERAGKTTPERKLTEKLADSWLPAIARQIKNHVARPRVLEFSKSFFQPLKNSLLQKISNEILNIMQQPELGPRLDKHFVSYSDDSKITRNFTKFAFSDFQQFKNNCKAESTSSIFRKGACPLNDLYTHSFNFMYDIRQLTNRSGPYPSISWYSQRITIKNFTEPPQHVSTFHRHWIFSIELVTGNNGVVHSIERGSVRFFFEPDVAVQFKETIENYLQLEIPMKLNLKQKKNFSFKC